MDLDKLKRSSKRSPIPGSHYKWIDKLCPDCGGRTYEMPVCCGAPEGMIECSKCIFQEKPSKFYKR